MKKTLKSVLLVAISTLLLFVLTGCANVNYEVKLNKDGSGEVSYIMGYDKSFLSSMQVSVDDVKEDDSFDEMKQEATEEGYTIEEYEDDNTYGFKAYKHIDNIQNEFDLDEELTEEDKIKYEKSFLKTKYSQDATLDLSDLAKDSGEDAFTTALLGKIKISYKIVLPFKVGDNNATTVSEDGKTLEWTLKAGQTNEIKFTAEENNTVVVAGVGILVLVVVLAIIVVLQKKGKKGKKGETKEPKTVTPKKEVVKEGKKEEPKVETKKEVKKEPVKEIKKEETKKEEPKEVKEQDSKIEQKQEEKKDDNKKEEK